MRFCRSRPVEYEVACGGIGPLHIPTPPALVPTKVEPGQPRLSFDDTMKSHDEWRAALTSQQRRYVDFHCRKEELMFSTLCGATPLVVAFDNQPVEFSRRWQLRVPARRSDRQATGRPPSRHGSRATSTAMAASRAVPSCSAATPRSPMAPPRRTASSRSTPLDDNRDGLVDPHDAAFASLLLWSDRNGDRQEHARRAGPALEQGRLDHARECESRSAATRARTASASAARWRGATSAACIAARSSTSTCRGAEKGQIQRQFHSQSLRILSLLSPHHSGHGGPACRPHASWRDMTIRAQRSSQALRASLYAPCFASFVPLNRACRRGIARRAQVVRVARRAAIDAPSDRRPRRCRRRRAPDDARDDEAHEASRHGQLRPCVRARAPRGRAATPRARARRGPSRSRYLRRSSDSRAPSSCALLEARARGARSSSRHARGACRRRCGSRAARAAPRSSRLAGGRRPRRSRPPSAPRRWRCRARRPVSEMRARSSQAQANADRRRRPARARCARRPARLDRGAQREAPARAGAAGIALRCARSWRSRIVRRDLAFLVEHVVGELAVVVVEERGRVVHPGEPAIEARALADVVVE